MVQGRKPVRTDVNPAIRERFAELAIVLMEFLEQDSFQRILQGLNFDAVDDVLREGVCQQAAGIPFADAARLQVEQGFGVQLADGGAVGAADVVGENL
jgi:hypothetical protein